MTTSKEKLWKFYRTFAIIQKSIEQTIPACIKSSWGNDMADVTGTWLGTYWQANMPTRFEATLVQGDNTISGRILDDSYLGEACLSGEVIGRSIHFTKRYLTTSPTPVQYIGTISEDGNSMQGTWSLGIRGSGPWEAHRGGDSLLAELQTRIAAKVPLTTR